METEQPANKAKMDLNALSRQVAVYGAETQAKLMALRVFILGVRGLGIEVAKNLVLAGPGKVVICDNEIVKVSDLGTNFYLRDHHVGKVTRAEAVLADLSNLNQSVEVSVSKTHDIEDLSKNFDVVVVTDHYDREYLVKLDHACRNNKVGFIYTGNLGLYGFAFVDYGDQHVVNDRDGEECKSVVIVGISRDAEGLVYSHEDKRHGFEDEDYIRFKEVKGLDGINGPIFKIKFKSPFSFAIGDTTEFPNNYEGGGIAQQVKVPIKIESRSLEESLQNPYPPGRKHNEFKEANKDNPKANNPFLPGKKEMQLCNWEKMGRPEECHFILNCLLSYQAKHKRLPRSLNTQDADEFVALVKHELEAAKNKMEVEGQFKVDKVDEQIARNIALYAETQISPCCSFWGGVVTQEIIKYTGKYTILRQWLHHDFLEILPEGAERSTRDDRYNDYQVIFGKKFVEDAAQVNTFMIGAGALGCQFIKMAALMGLCTKGKFTCTDDDNIEISNLNRQFLFRRENVGGNKSEVACQTGRKMNPEVQFDSKKLRVDPENDETFNDEFWENLCFVINAVDNVKARLYVDSKCVWYGKPLFQSGTLGTKCNSQMIIPKYTQSYGDSQDPPEETIPLCTLKNFPYQIEHTIQWARDNFAGAFVQGPNEASKFYKNPKEYLEKSAKELQGKPISLRMRLESVKKLIEAQQKHNYESCVQLARYMFQDIFYNQIAQLIHSFPLDHKTENGKLFWSGLKRAPGPIKFDSSDPRHIEFIQSSANIYAHIFGLPMESDPAVVAKIASHIHVPDFQPKKIVIKTEQGGEATNAAAETPVEEQDEEVVAKLEKQLIAMNLNLSGKWHLIEFEKDDPTNFHIEQVASTSNLRARNYKIEEVDNFKVKLIAGKIIPAIATTTAMVVGAVGIEIIKNVLKHKNELYKNSFMNLAIPLWVFSDPMPPIEHEDKEYDEILLGPVKAIPPKFTTWDKIQVNGPMTLAQFKQFFEKEYKVTLSMISIGQTCVFNKYSPDSVKRLPMNILDVYQTLSGKQYPKYKRYMQIEVNGQTLEGNVDAVLPSIKYKL